MADIRRLPTPVTEVWDWQVQGSCRELGDDLFFHPERERDPARTVREARAKSICRMCPVIRECRAHALSVREPYGVWGGLTETERAAIVRGPGEDGPRLPRHSLHRVR
ncbi:WhiB family transcriptional regulator [Pseudonocardia ailaonensis]|uniref:Transcriptional regulator WhiB n=1 Tax=Pseudonocardia ailaonensis TaxID=367279 RepID=A0ABN2NFE6_9PSEU